MVVYILIFKKYMPQSNKTCFKFKKKKKILTYVLKVSTRTHLLIREVKYFLRNFDFCSEVSTPVGTCKSQSTSRRFSCKICRRQQTSLTEEKTHFEENSLQVFSPNQTLHRISRQTLILIQNLFFTCYYIQSRSTYILHHNE